MNSDKTNKLYHNGFLINLILSKWYLKNILYVLRCHFFKHHAIKKAFGFSAIRIREKIVCCADSRKQSIMLLFVWTRGEIPRVLVYWMSTQTVTWIWCSQRYQGMKWPGGRGEGGGDSGLLPRISKDWKGMISRSVRVKWRAWYLSLTSFPVTRIGLIWPSRLTGHYKNN